MDAKLKAKWVGALRSGRYPQSTWALRNQEGYCCLGVLCRVAGAELKRNDAIGEQEFVWRGEAASTYLPETLRKDLSIPKRTQKMLAKQNDYGLSFKMIANIIENSKAL